MTNLKVEVDEAADIVTVNGRQYTGEFLRFLSVDGGKSGILFYIFRNNKNQIAIGRYYLNGLLRFIVEHWWKDANGS